MDDNGRRRPVVIIDDDEREAKRIRLDKAVMPTPTPTTIFDSKGDLHLVVGSDVRAGDPSTFLVCSRTLARASPVFDKMLFGPFVEARPSPELSKQESAWVVHLPEDDPNHLGVVLNILHCNFKMVPQNFSSPLLSGMVAVADKYDCIEIFRPWVSSCIPSLDYDHFHNPKFVLHIAWHLGCIDTFRQALLAIIEHSFISEMDEIFIFTRPQSTGRMPPWEEPQDLHEYLGNLVPMEVVDQIKHHRAKFVHKMMEPFVTLHDDLVNGRPCCSIPDDQDECDGMLLGCLVRNFRWRGLDEPTKDAVQRYSGSIIDLEDNLGGMKLMTLRSHDEFEDCYKNLQKRGMNVRRVPCIGKRSEAVVLLPQQKEHMGRQAVKSGLV